METFLNNGWGSLIVGGVARVLAFAALGWFCFPSGALRPCSF